MQTSSDKLLPDHLHLSLEWQRLASLRGVGLAIITAILAYGVYCKLLHPLARYPGPFWAGFGPLWATYVTFKGDWLNIMTELHRIHGPVVRIARNEVDIDDPAAVEAIYGISKGFLKTEFYMGFGNPQQPPNIFSTMDASYHSQMRRFMGSAFTMKSLQSLDPQINQGVAALLAHLLAYADKDAPVDLGWKLKCLAFDLSCYISNGQSTGAIEGKDTTGLLDAVGFAKLLANRKTSALMPSVCNNNKMTSQQAFAASLGRVWNIRKMIQKGKPPAKLLRAFTFMAEFLQEQVRKHSPTDEAPSDMMGHIMKSQHGKDRKAYPDLAETDLLYAEVSQTVIAAGADTTGTTLIAMLYYLGHSPASQRKLQEEVDSVASEIRPDGTFESKTVNEMVYLNAVIKETLRMHPAVGMPLPRYVPAAGFQLGDNYFPPGAIVGVNAWHIHQHESIFGKDCGTFKPERWLEGSQNQLATMDKFLLSFGYGSRTCLGKNISIVEMRLVIPALLSRYKFELSEPTAPLRFETKWFALLEHLNVKLNSRGQL